jgi:signal transduction histidine kinase
MNLPLRARLTAWYFAVLIVSFASLAWISDYGFRRSILTTVNDASRANLESIRSVLLRTAPQGMYEVKDELNEMAGLWAGGALLEVADEQGSLIFQSPAFQHAYPPLPLANGQEPIFFTTNLDHVQYRIAISMIDAGGQKFRVRAAVSTEPLDQALDRFRLILKLTLPLLVIVASLGGYWLSRRALAPVDEIIKTARGIGVQNLSGRLAVPGPQDELRRLTETLNDMLARIEISFKRITQFTADASHDLRTPVALIRTSAELALRRSRSEEEYREVLTRILGTSVETTHLIENLLTLARADAGAGELELRRTDLIPPLEKAAEQASVLAAARIFKFRMVSQSIPCGSMLTRQRSNGSFCSSSKMPSNTPPMAVALRFGCTTVGALPWLKSKTPELAFPQKTCPTSSSASTGLTKLAPASPAAPVSV